MHSFKTPPRERRNTEQLRVYRPRTAYWNWDRLLTSCSFGIALLTILMFLVGERALIQYALYPLGLSLLLYVPVVLRHV